MNGIPVVPMLWLESLPGPLAAQPGIASQGTIYISNDNCPDYTWGFTEEQTRLSFAEIVRAHLAQMTRPDA